MVIKTFFEETYQTRQKLGLLLDDQILEELKNLNKQIKENNIHNISIQEFYKEVFNYNHSIKKSIDQFQAIIEQRGWNQENVKYNDGIVFFEELSESAQMLEIAPKIFDMKNVKDITLKEQCTSQLTKTPPIVSNVIIKETPEKRAEIPAKANIPSPPLNKIQEQKLTEGTLENLELKKLYMIDNTLEEKHIKILNC